MSATSRQSLVFSTLAVLLIIVTVTLPKIDSEIELLIFALSVSVLGVPHGALDPIYARHLYVSRGFLASVIFVGAYVALALSVIFFWFFSPVIFLILFLTASTFHFSGDPSQGTPWLIRLLYGGTIIVLPTLNHASEMSRLYSYLVDSNAADQFVSTLRFLAWPWVVGICLSVIFICKRDMVAAVELASFCLLAIVASPLLSFSLFFCVMHSMRHMLRTQKFSGLLWSQLLRLSLLPSLAVFVFVFLVWFFGDDTPLDMQIIQFVIIGLAALTAPHMLLIERVRLVEIFNNK